MAYTSKEVIDLTGDDSSSSELENTRDHEATAPTSSLSSPKKKKKTSKARSAVDTTKPLADIVKQDSTAPAMNQDGLVDAMKFMKLMDVLAGEVGKVENAEHKFWSTQPVPQAGDEPATESGPIEPPVPPEQVRQEPYPLPKDFEWTTVDMRDSSQCKEVYELLCANYVEDDDAEFRFAYTAPFLAWALMQPGYHPTWHLGVRVSSTKRLIGFIAGVPMRLRVRESIFDAAEINFICVHKKLRSKRLAPLLIKEVTRRCHLLGISQAIYTIGKELPTPVSACRYYHRTIQVSKLVNTGFTYIPRGKTLARLKQEAQLPMETSLEGLREMTRADIPQVLEIMTKFMDRYDMCPIMSLVEAEHTFLSGTGMEPKINPAHRTDQVVWSYVVEQRGTVTDFFSFYSLPSTIIDKTRGHNMLEAAYLFYYGTDLPADEPSLKQRLCNLVEDALVIARDAGFDVFNALTLMDNASFLEKLQFGKGSGLLNYYLYNWRTPPLEGHIRFAKSEGGRGAGRGVGVVML